MTHVELTERSIDLIEERLKSGIYKDADAVVQAGLESLRDEDERLRDLLRAAIAELDRGEGRVAPAPEEMAASIIARGTQRLNRKP